MHWQRQRPPAQCPAQHVRRRTAHERCQAVTAPERHDRNGEPGTYESLFKAAADLADGLEGIARDCGVPLQVNRVGAMFSAFFTDEPVTDYRSACNADAEKFARYYRAMLEAGVYLAPSQFEAAFVSTAHSEQDIAYTLEQAERALRAL